ncbi:hypothetical protein [Phocaeicola vulgatus]|uniref:hypothetical protein n=2 Tax=Bacteroidaceae TaxID=815 RepID=UPI00356529E5
MQLSCPEVMALPSLYHLAEPLLTPAVNVAALPTDEIWSTAALPLTNREGVNIRYGDAAHEGAYAPVSLLNTWVSGCEEPINACKETASFWSMMVTCPRATLIAICLL